MEIYRNTEKNSTRISKQEAKGIVNIKYNTLILIFDDEEKKER